MGKQHRDKKNLFLQVCPGQGRQQHIKGSYTQLKRVIKSDKMYKSQYEYQSQFIVECRSNSSVKQHTDQPFPT